MFGTIVATSVVLILLALAGLEFADALVDLRRLALGPAKSAEKQAPVVLAPEAPYEAPYQAEPLRKAA